ncbi:hypothetical protein LXA43DRAFT_901107 [Ganoderma leucocontextum]|nr:hypothetical protein LXA43DRAFT_902519 [Ganoderma leucocontextum]KAI1784722.1 hypothetical protein LXA43DRAFT_901107 [Ganoderma leucocontextum]
MGTVPFQGDAPLSPVTIISNYGLAFIPKNLEPRTQAVLRHLMRKPKAKSDGPGYIYALRLIDNAHPDRVHIKLGRTNDIPRRLSEHRRRCPSSRHVLLGHTGLVPHCDRLERLIHIELADRAAQAYPAGRTAPRTRCTDCGSVHTEIFTFRPFHGRNFRNEWLRSIVERWAQFVSSHVI